MIYNAKYQNDKEIESPTKHNKQFTIEYSLDSEIIFGMVCKFFMGVWSPFLVGYKHHLLLLQFTVKNETKFDFAKNVRFLFPPRQLVLNYYISTQYKNCKSIYILL
jgi:hypothetical protein